MTLEPNEPGEAGEPSEPQEPGATWQAVGEPSSVPTPSREYRATVAFLVGGLFTLVVLLMFSGSLSTAPPIRGLLFVAGVIVGMLAMFVVAYGLAGGRAWAVAVMTPMLALLVIAGAVELVSALSRGAIDLPLGLALGLWAWRAPIRTPIEAGSASRAWGIIGSITFAAMLLSTLWPTAGGLLLRPGGPLIVDRDALQPSLAMDCDSAPGQAPTFVRLAYDWRWARAEPWVAGTDSITLSAFILRDEGQSGYVLTSTDQSSAGTWQSNVMIGEQPGMVFGIDLAIAGFRPGSVGIGLTPAGTPPTGHGSVEITARYLHAPAGTDGPDVPALWKVITEASCDW